MRSSLHLLAFGLAAGPERGENAAFPGRKWRDQLRHVDAQRSRKPIQDIDRRIERTLFNAADVGAVNVSVHRERLLGDALRGPKASKISGNAGAAVHAAHATSLRLFKPSNMFDILDFVGDCRAVAWPLGGLSIENCRNDHLVGPDARHRAPVLCRRGWWGAGSGSRHVR